MAWKLTPFYVGRFRLLFGLLLSVVELGAFYCGDDAGTAFADEEMPPCMAEFGIRDTGEVGEALALLGGPFVRKRKQRFERVFGVGRTLCEPASVGSWKEDVFDGGVFLVVVVRDYAFKPVLELRQFQVRPGGIAAFNEVLHLYFVDCRFVGGQRGAVQYFPRDGENALKVGVAVVLVPIEIVNEAGELGWVRVGWALAHVGSVEPPDEIVVQVVPGFHEGCPLGVREKLLQRFQAMMAPDEAKGRIGPGGLAGRGPG